MIVSLDPALSEDLVDALSQQVYPVSVMTSERAVLASLQQAPPAVLVIDAQLSQMNGFELAQEVRRQVGPGQVAIIVLTEVPWGPSQKAAAIQQMGLTDLLIKPQDLGRLTQQVIQLLEQHRLVNSSSSTKDGARRSVPGATSDASELHRDSPAASSDQQEHQRVNQAVRQLRLSVADLRGNLSMTSFPQLLHLLYRRRVNGALFLLRDRVKKIVYFKDGHPTFIKSNLLSECLGKVLVHEGLITEAQCKASLTQMKRARRQQGTVLIEMGLISPHNLVVGLQLQLQTKLMDIFSWTRGEYLFKSEVNIPNEAIRLDVSNATLLADGIRRTWPRKRLEEALAAQLDCYLVATPDPELRFQELNLDEEEQAFFDNIDGTKSLRQLLSETSLSTLKAHTTAFILLTTGVVETSDAPIMGEEPAPLVRSSSAPEESRRKRLAAQLISFQQRDAYGVLGVSTEASTLIIEEAYRTLAREYHPDRFHHLSQEVRQLASEIFSLIDQAYRQISSIDLRRRYEQSYNAALHREASATGSNTLSSERLQQEAMSFMAQGQWAKAVTCLSRAVDLCPGAGELRSWLGWAIFSADSQNTQAIQRAISELRRAIELDPRHDQAYLSLGRVYAAMGKSILAERQFEKAVQCNPDCHEALEELRWQKLRRPPRRRSKTF